MAAFTYGFLTMNGRKIASVEEIQLEVTREQDEIRPCDVPEAEEIVPTQLKYQLSFKRAYIGPDFFKAMRNGTKLGAVLFRRDPDTNKATAVRDISGIVLNKIVMGPINGNKHVVEDITAGATKVVEMD